MSEARDIYFAYETVLPALVFFVAHPHRYLMHMRVWICNIKFNPSDEFPPGLRTPGLQAVRAGARRPTPQQWRS